MYLPRPHRVEDRALQHDFIRANPLGLLVTNGPGGLIANPLPFHLDAKAGDAAVLCAHMARANPQWREIGAIKEALIVFQNPGVYVTPSWYPSKRETHEVVPTWNYVCVQARGPMRVIEDRAWLHARIDEMTAAREAGRAAPWSPSDAPADFIERMIDAVVGVEMTIERLDGKWKTSQNRSRADREGVVEGLRADGDAAALHMADLVQRTGETR